MGIAGLDIIINDIEMIARKWKITELSLFGSALRADFSESSDVDMLIEFAKETHYSLFDLVDLKEELESVLGRRVDIVEKASLKNPFRKKEILKTIRKIYES